MARAVVASNYLTRAGPNASDHAARRESLTCSLELSRELLGWLFRENREILRLLAVQDFRKSLGGKAALEQFPYRRRPARHPLCKTPGVDGPKFFLHEHNLESFASIKLTHSTLPAIN